MFVTPVPNLETPNFLLRPLRAADYEDLFNVAADPLIWEQHPMKDRFTAEGFAKHWKVLTGLMAPLVIVERASGEMVGTSSFYDYVAEAREVLIGYPFLCRKYWGVPYNREIKQAMLAYAFEFVDRVIFHVGSTNLRSRAALKKIGATEVAEVDTVLPDGRPARRVVFWLEKTDYRKPADQTSVC